MLPFFSFRGKITGIQRKEERKSVPMRPNGTKLEKRVRPMSSQNVQNFPPLFSSPIAKIQHERGRKQVFGQFFFKSQDERAALSHSNLKINLLTMRKKSYTRWNSASITNISPSTSLNTFRGCKSDTSIVPFTYFASPTLSNPIADI